MPKKKKSDSDTLNPVAKLEKPLDISLDEKDKFKDEGLYKLIDEFKSDIEGFVADRTANSNKILLAYMRRRGLIGKEEKNLPFPKSSDLRYPIEEMMIRIKKGGYVSVVCDAPKIVKYTPLKPNREQSKDRLEHFMNYVFRCLVPRFRFQVAGSADKMLEAGYSYAKVTWRYTTEWRTRVILKEEADKVAETIKQKKQQAAAQKVAQMFQQIQQKNAILQQQGQPPIPMPAMPEPDEKEFDATDDELIEVFAKAKGIDLKATPKKRDQIESTIKQWRDGKDPITWMEEVVTYRGPAIEHIQENQSVIMSGQTPAIGQAELLCHEMYYSERELRSASAKNGGRFDEDAVEDLIAEKKPPVADIVQDRLDMESQRNAAEGIKSRMELEGYFRLHEVFCWIPRKEISRFLSVGGDDDVPVRSMMTYSPDVDPRSIPPLVLTEFPYDHMTWPLHQFKYNYTVDRVYDSRGICELIEPFAREYCTSSNAAMDRHTLTLTPPTIVWDQANLQTSSFRSLGQVMESAVPPADAVLIPQFPNLSEGMEFDAEKCLKWINDVLGNANVTQVAGRQDSPTQDEIQALREPSQGIDYFEHVLWLDVWSDIFRQVHALCKQYWFTIEDKFTFARADKPDEYVTITKADFDGEFIIQAGGDPAKQSALMEFQKWFTFLQMALQYPEVKLSTKMYELISIVANKLLGYAEASGVVQTKQVAEQVTQAAMKSAEAAFLAKMEGKRTQRQPRVKQVPGSGAGMLAK